MPFKYVAYTQNGERMAGRLETEVVSAAEAVLWQQGLIVVSLKKEAAPVNIYALFPTFFKIKNQDIVAFCRQLVTLLDSGLPIVSAITILHRQIRHPVFKQAMVKIRQDVESGNSVSEALSKHPRVFSTFLVRMVRIGEETGRLQPTLTQVADYMEKQAQVAGQVKKALTYPSLVLGASFVSVFLLLTYSLPSITPLMKEFGAEIPRSTRLLMGMSSFVSANVRGIFLVLLGMAALGYWFLGRPVNRHRRAALAMRLPIISNILLSESVSRFSYSLSFLLRAGVNFIDALDLLVQTIDNPVMNQAVQEMRQTIHLGQRLSTAVEKQAIFPPLAVMMIQVGEETGRLENNLSLLAKFYENDTEQRISRMTALIEPTIIIGVGLFVGFIAVSIMSFLYGMLPSMK